MRLIDADVLLKEMIGVTDGWVEPPKDWYKDFVRNAPTVNSWMGLLNQDNKKETNWNQITEETSEDA